MKSTILKIAGVFGLVSLAHANDDVIAFSVGTALNISLSASDLLIGPRMSTALMRKCIAQETETFSRDDLERIHPEFPKVLDDAIQAELLRLSDPENDWHVRNARSAIDHDAVAQALQEGNKNTAAMVDSILARNSEQLAIALEFAEANADQANAALEGRNAKVLVDTLISASFVGGFEHAAPFDKNSLDYSTRVMNSDAMVFDFSRAAGYFTIACSDGICSVNDYFDFDVSPNIFTKKQIDTNLEKMQEAFLELFAGNYDDAAKNVGTLFCQEGLHEQPTESSISISIRLNLAIPNLEL